MRSYPPSLLPPPIQAALQRLGVPGREGVTLTTGEDLPPEIPRGETILPLAAGDRREVLLASTSALAQLPAGSPIGIPAGPGARRLRALLRGLHPRLEPVEDASRNGGPDPVIVALWPEPALEVRGEVLDPATWLPAPGQGIAVLRLGPGVELPGVTADPAVAAVLVAERSLARRFPGVVVCCRALAFGDDLRLSALLLSADGSQAVRGAASGPRSAADDVAGRVAALLRQRGADLIASSPPSPLNPASP